VSCARHWVRDYESVFDRSIWKGCLVTEMEKLDSAPTKPAQHVTLKHVEIVAFRRLGSVRLDVEPEVTVLVGSNNSGKTSVIWALRQFLSDRPQISALDLSTDGWPTMNKLGTRWEASAAAGESEATSVEQWELDRQAIAAVMPFVDLWFHVGDVEGYRYVAPLIPSLSWSGGLVGVRLRIEPFDGVRDLQLFAQEFVRARKVVTGTDDAARLERAWPIDLHDYLLRKPAPLRRIVGYKLDGQQLRDPTDLGAAQPQNLSPWATPVPLDAVHQIVVVDFIAAQRGLGSEESETTPGGAARRGGLFSKQLVEFAKKHWEIGSLLDDGRQDMHRAVARAESDLDEQIEKALFETTRDVRTLGYPGLHDHRGIRFRSRIDTETLLAHETAVQYQQRDEAGEEVTLPEHSIGLGFQNLQAVSYRLAAFRLGRVKPPEDKAIAPVHLVLLEEPEAHLHVQAQRIFAQRAYQLLEPRRPEHAHLSCHLIISTHSSHLAHAGEFGRLRYLRRMPGRQSEVLAKSVVVSLANVFGTNKNTRRFAERFLRLQHTDLLFADAAIFIEGTAERLLVPYFIDRDFDALASRYLSYLEVGGSHAHRLRPLIERLGIPTVIITDLDPGAKNASGQTAGVAVADGQTTMNTTLSSWLPKLKQLNELHAANEGAKICQPLKGHPSRIRVAFQVAPERDAPCAASLEDALIMENQSFFKSNVVEGSEAGRVVNCVKKTVGAQALAKELHELLRTDFDKGAFAMDVLDAAIQADSEDAIDGADSESEVPSRKLKCPAYIAQAIRWLENELREPTQEST
jgi:predicted ATP-dependent endonuclease of OLD family